MTTGLPSRSHPHDAPHLILEGPGHCRRGERLLESSPGRATEPHPKLVVLAQAADRSCDVPGIWIVEHQRGQLMLEYLSRPAVPDGNDGTLGDCRLKQSE